MSEHKKTNSTFGRKGYYIALILCAVAIGISGYVYYQNLNETQTVLSTGETLSTVTTQPGSNTLPTGTESPTQPTTLKTSAPLTGETVAPFAVECLSYNTTTRDWRTHHGVDIAAEAGTTVCAAADGTVYSVYEDEALGNTVVITHTGGYTTKYASLGEDVSVTPGDTVTMGQAIGTVGNTALLENSLAPHVHFSVTCGGADMDPADFLKLGQ